MKDINSLRTNSVFPPLRWIAKVTGCSADCNNFAVGSEAQWNMQSTTVTLEGNSFTGGTEERHVKYLTPSQGVLRSVTWSIYLSLSLTMSSTASDFIGFTVGKWKRTANYPRISLEHNRWVVSAPEYNSQVSTALHTVGFVVPTRSASLYTEPGSACMTLQWSAPLCSVFPSFAVL
jgi:hypothetical protein